MAEQHMKEAEKALSTSFFKRKPEYDIAASAFENAAKAYQFQKDYTKAIDAYIKSSQAHSNADNYYFAAKCLESVAGIQSKDLKDAVQAAKTFYEASQMFRRNNNIERAIEQLEKAGKTLEQAQQYEEAVKYFVEACDLYEAEDKLRIGLETFKKVTNLHLKCKKFAEAAQWSKLRVDKVMVKVDGKHLTMRQFLSNIIIHLALGDEVEARKLYDGYSLLSPIWMNADENLIALKLLQGFEERDQNLVTDAAKAQIVGFLDNEVARLARSLKAPGALSPPEPEKLAADPTETSLLCDDKPAEKPAAEETSDLC